MVQAALPVIPSVATEDDRPAGPRKIRDFWWAQDRTGLWVPPSFRQITFCGYELGDSNPNNMLAFTVKSWAGRIVTLDTGEQLELVGPMCEPYRRWADLGPEYNDDQPLGPPPPADWT